MRLLSIILIIVAIILSLFGLFYLYMLYMRALLRQMFKDILPIIDSSGLDYWIDYGTLLGFARNKDIIFGDFDIDICVWNTPSNIDILKTKIYPKIASPYTFIKEDWSAYRVFRPTPIPFLKAHMDIYLLDKNDSGFVSLDVGNANSGDTIPSNLLENFTKMNMLGVDVRVPTEYISVLKARYGNSFMTPSLKCLGFFCIPQFK